MAVLAIPPVRNTARLAPRQALERSKERHLFSKTYSTSTLWSLLVGFCLAIAPAQAQNLFVANQAGNTIREFSPSGVDLGDFATTGLNGPTAFGLRQERQLRFQHCWQYDSKVLSQHTSVTSPPRG